MSDMRDENCDSICMAFLADEISRFWRAPNQASVRPAAVYDMDDRPKSWWRSGP
jgi:hypothetical protein